jgi:hypothetical protein
MLAFLCVCFREYVRFCFTRIIQHELDLVRQEWNDHQIRRQNGEVYGKPEILYHHPDLYGIMLIIIKTSDSFHYQTFSFIEGPVAITNAKYS